MFSLLRGEAERSTTALRSNLKNEITALRAELKETISSHRAELVRWVFAVIVGQTAMLLGVLYFFIKLAR